VRFACSIMVDWIRPGLCGASAAMQNAPDAASTLAQLRSFRDDVLARLPHGQTHTNDYYKYSGELIKLMMFNPRLLAHTRETLERYTPVAQQLVNREHAKASQAKTNRAGQDIQTITVSQGDLAEIDGLLKSFTDAGASQQLQQTIRELRTDIFDPKVQREFGINVVEGEKRGMPGSATAHSGT